MWWFTAVFNTAMSGKEVVIEILFWKSEQIGSKSELKIE